MNSQKMLLEMSLKDRLLLTMEGDVIRALLSGNDVGCFSTEQYCEARDEWVSRVAGATREELGLPTACRKLARVQLLAVELVDEVKPDVWALKAGLDPSDGQR